ncbi:hypothetical protein S7335_3929 [Synechococcus sp. PCC 7335]|uniref:hypothetical protein n=1 Tax=Synechococcus sp. (strain ATCC 29403 / PCC 7335) TaxID=91464 RepID=UPI00017EB878|nr:hypothetical protein [Synechococcus sp. PCC 7335]EDX86226.1 hypothetical protein S7335_3929 [Synechococcus sp. PCC 7335]
MKSFLMPDLSASISSTLVGTEANAAMGTRARLAVASAFGVISSSFVLLGASPAVAAPDYFGCTAGMLDAGIPQESAIAACASARYPDALGACVVDVSEFTGLAAESALLVCGRSRRPVEVANCTIGIHDSLLETPSTKVLENCGRSLLPDRYGSCVVDISDATEATVDTALEQCIRAGFRPWRIQPTL